MEPVQETGLPHHNKQILTQMLASLPGPAFCQWAPFPDPCTLWLLNSPLPLAHYLVALYIPNSVCTAGFLCFFRSELIYWEGFRTENIVMYLNSRDVCLSNVELPLPGSVYTFTPHVLPYFGVALVIFLFCCICPCQSLMKHKMFRILKYPLPYC